jgi:AraC-like DNA-binding protein
MLPYRLTESAKLWRPAVLEGVELMHATYVTRSFPRHVHDGFAVGVIEQGALGFYYRGTEVIAPAGAVNLANPDEVHTGHAAADGGWTYRMFYFSTDRLQQAASQMSGRPAGTPLFPMGVIHDTQLASRLRNLHLHLESDCPGSLSAQSLFLDLLVRLIERYADAPLRVKRATRHAGIARARACMQERWREDLSLDTLATESGLSPFHFTRQFAEMFGLPPHAYLIQLRVHHAKALLATGRPIAAVAFQTGFSDQSHLTRHFKRYLGITPGQYRHIVRPQSAADVAL